mmetsp:Transcript_11903/g.24578  ORF Transcript_11903/g.24578 Transcript_11903/m.24578 type:complete len:87 (-) Transcript_11903:3-263(-)
MNRGDVTAIPKAIEALKTKIKNEPHQITPQEKAVKPESQKDSSTPQWASPRVGRMPTTPLTTPNIDRNKQTSIRDGFPRNRLKATL